MGHHYVYFLIQDALVLLSRMTPPDDPPGSEKASGHVIYMASRRDMFCSDLGKP